MGLIRYFTEENRKVGMVRWEVWLFRFFMGTLIPLAVAMMLGLIGFLGWSGWDWWRGRRPCAVGHTERQTVCVRNAGHYCGAYAEQDVYICTRHEGD